MNKIELGDITMGSVHEIDGYPVAQASCRCSDPTEETQIYFDSCEDVKTTDIGEKILDDQGRILEVEMTLRRVCPGKRVAVGVALTEVDANGNEYPRGLKTITVPAHCNPYCTDIPVTGIRFILPEDISVGTSVVRCRARRHFIARIDAHHIDITGNMPTAL